MPQHSVTVRCPVPSSFAVDQVRGMFDLPRIKEATETFAVEVPHRGDLIDGKGWQLGVIVGPSGSGKSTVARDIYGDQFVDQIDWDPTQAVVDQFGDADMKQVVGVLNAVGFSSPPAWVKPHQVLSGGERFRCDLARALLSNKKLLAFDEFTSVVDRIVAKVGSAAIAKSIRKGRIQKQFVAVTCHYDVIDWLQPDWVLDMASCELTRGCLRRRPPIELEIAPVHRSAWHLFRRHHYLNHEIHKGAKCFVAFWGNDPVAFSSWMPRMTRKRGAGDMREHRTVVLPDFQGVGIGNRLSEMCASVWTGIGGRAFSTTSHPAMIRYRNSSPNWRTVRHGMVSPSGNTGQMMRDRKEGDGPIDSVGRVTGGFQYIGPPMDRERAEIFAGEFPQRHILRAFPHGATSVESLARRANYSTTAVNLTLGDAERKKLVERVPFGKGRFIYELTDAGRAAIS